MVKKILSGILVITVMWGSVGCSQVKIKYLEASGANISAANRYTATVEAKDFYIMSEINGKISNISIDQGDIVKQGEKVLELESSLYDIQKRQAQGALDAAKAAQIGLTENPKESIESQSVASIAAAKADVEAAQLQINKCTINSPVTGTITAVYTSEGQIVSPAPANTSSIIKITVSDFDSYDKVYVISTEVTGKVTQLNVKVGDLINKGQLIAQLDTNVYETQKSKALANLALAEAKQSELNENPKESEAKKSQANVDQAQAALDIAQLQIDRCNISAQGTGVIEDVYVNKGEVISAGMNIAKVMDTENKYAKIYVEEAKRNAVKLGQNLSIYSNNKVIGKGIVEYVASESEFTPKNTETKSEKDKTVFQVKVKLDATVDVAPGAMVDVEMK